MEDKEIDIARQYSKTFIFDDLFGAIDAVNVLDLRVVRALHDNKLRITVQGNQLAVVEKLMQLFGAKDAANDQGKWSDSV